MLEWGLDILLGLGLLWLSWQAMTCSDLFKAIVLFIAFGLLMAVAWVRLEAPDVALAEAAIGAGLTGALLLGALSKLRSKGADEESIGEGEDKGLRKKFPQWVPIIISLVVGIGLGAVVYTLPVYTPGLSSEVMANLKHSGVSNAVTAVLLNFRGYDTLLELFVLLLALVGVWSLRGEPPQQGTAPGPVLNTLSRLLVPVLILVSVYLLWIGGRAPGGAFQAGSVLGAMGVLLLLSGWRVPSGLREFPFRLVLVAGPAAFLALAALTLAIEGGVLEYPTRQAGTLIYVLETAATLSIGLTLAALFLGSRPQNKESK